MIFAELPHEDFQAIQAGNLGRSKVEKLVEHRHQNTNVDNPVSRSSVYIRLIKELADIQIIFKQSLNTTWRNNVIKICSLNKTQLGKYSWNRNAMKHIKSSFVYITFIAVTNPLRTSPPTPPSIHRDGCNTVSRSQALGPLQPGRESLKSVVELKQLGGQGPRRRNNVDCDWLYTCFGEKRTQENDTKNTHLRIFNLLLFKNPCIFLCKSKPFPIWTLFYACKRDYKSLPPESFPKHNFPQLISNSSPPSYTSLHTHS